MIKYLVWFIPSANYNIFFLIHFICRVNFESATVFYRLRKNKMSKVEETYVFHKQQPRAKHKRFLNISDSLFSIFIVGPLVVSFWRGIWNYMDEYEEYYPGWSTFLLGNIMHCIFALAREYFVDKIQNSSSKKTIHRRIFRNLILRIYTYVFAISIVIHWRGGWLIYDQKMGMKNSKISVYDKFPIQLIKHLIGNLN